MDLAAIRPFIAAGGLADVAACRAELVAIGSVRGLLDALEVDVVRRLDVLAASDVAIFPQEVVATASRSSLSAAERLRERAAACSAIPELGAALAAGSTGGDRVDIVVRATSGLSAGERAALAGHGRRLALAAGEQTASGFRKTVENVVRQVRVDDGLAQLDRQRRQARLRWWLDGNGMWNLSGRFDPATGARLEGRLRNTVERLFAKAAPDGCPTDPLEKQEHLAALALATLLDVDGAASGAPDVTVIIDERTLRDGHAHQATVCDIALGRFGLPVETTRRWACLGTVTPVVTASDGTRLLLGRETRLANRAQRRALRVLYQSCALCEVPFDHCQVHHVSWYTLGGLTDLDNMLPLCSRHHHLVHEGGWQVHLAPDRALTVTRPGGAISTHPPPQACAA